MFFDRVYGNLVGDNILGNMPPYATGIGTAIRARPLQSPFCPACPRSLGFIPRTPSRCRPRLAPGRFGAQQYHRMSTAATPRALLTQATTRPCALRRSSNTISTFSTRFAHGWVLDVGYVGTHGIHLFDWNRDPNIAYLVDCGPASATCNPPTDQVNTILERPASSFPMNEPPTATTGFSRIPPRNYLGRVQLFGRESGEFAAG